MSFCAGMRFWRFVFWRIGYREAAQSNVTYYELSSNPSTNCQTFVASGALESACFLLLDVAGAVTVCGPGRGWT